MIEELLPLAVDFVTVTPESERALQGEALAAEIRERGIPAKCLADIAEIPGNLSGKEKNIALGSLYFIGELRAMWKEQNL